LIRSFGVGIALEFRLSWIKFDLSGDSWRASFFLRSDACLKMCITFCLGVSLAFFVRWSCTHCLYFASSTNWIEIVLLVGIATRVDKESFV